MTEKMKFENAWSLSSNELKELQKFKESNLEGLDENNLKQLKDTLQKEKEWYDSRSKNEKSKQWIDGMIDKVIIAIDKRLPKETQAPVVEKPVVEEETTPVVKEISKPKETLSATDTEEKFNENLEKELNPETTTIFTVGNQVMVMKFDNATEKKQADKIFLSLEKGFSDDKMAAYAMSKFLTKYKDNIKSIDEVYKEAWKGLNWTQIVYIENKDDRSKALLDAAESKDVKVIDVDKWSAIWNTLIKTFTLDFGWDTANVTKETLDDRDYGKKLTSTDLLNGYYKKVENDEEENENDEENELVQEPLWHFERSEIVANIADKIENILDDDKIDDKEWNTAEWQIAMKYLKSAWFTEKQIRSWAVEIKSEFKQDDAIKTWLDKEWENGGKKVIDNMITEKPAIEITKDGFMHMNPDQAIWDKKFIKVKLDGVKNGDKVEDKEIIMKAAKLDYNSLWFNQDIADQLASMPPIVLKDGTMFSFGKEWMYVLGKEIWDGADAVKDYIKNHQIVAAAIAGWLIWALLVKWIKLPEINLKWLGKWLEKLWHEIWHAVENWAKSIKDLFKHIDLSSLNSLFGGYLLTAIPMNYQIEWLERQLAEISATYEWSDSINAEIDAIMNPDKKWNTKDNFNEQAQNEYSHFMLVKNGFAKPGELTALVMKAEVNENGESTINVEWSKDHKILVWDKELYIPEWKSLEIKLDKDGKVQTIDGQINISVAWTDDYIKFNWIANAWQYYEWKLIWSNVIWKKALINSIDDIVKYIDTEKKESKKPEKKETKENTPEVKYTADSIEAALKWQILSTNKSHLDGTGDSHDEWFINDVKFDKTTWNLQFDVNIEDSWSDLTIKVDKKNPTDNEIVTAVNDALTKKLLDKQDGDNSDDEWN